MSRPFPTIEEDLGIIEAFVRRVRLIWRLLRDERVPVIIKAPPMLAIIYVVFPIDFVPDIFLPIGGLDDIAALIFGFSIFVELVPPDIVREHERELMARPAPQLKEGDEINES